MPAIMENPSFENFSPKKQKGFTKEYGGGGSGGDGRNEKGAHQEKFKPGGKGKRSFLKQVKRFGKQGKLGRGFQVDSETYSYFVRVYELLRKDDFENDEEREIFAENSLGSETEGKEVDLSSNQLVSRVIESILPMASEETIVRFGEAFTPSLRTIVSDSFASHVLEKLLEVTSSTKWRTSEKLTTWFEKTSMYVLNNFEDFTFDKYGSFVMKKVLECLSGLVEAPSDPVALKFKVFRNSVGIELFGLRQANPKWEKMLHTFATRFAAWPQLNDLKERAETSRLVQNVIQTVNRTTIKGSKELVKQLILRVLETLPGSLDAGDNVHHIIEACLSAADKEMFGKIFDKYYKGHLADYCTGQCYTLQKLISRAPDNKTFTKIFEELEPVLTSKIIKQGKDAVIHEMATQCANLKAKQEEFYGLLKKASTGSTVLMTLISMKGVRKEAEVENRNNDPEEKKTDKLTTSYYGTHAVQMLIDFDNSQEIVNCILDLNEALLKTLCLDPKASFIISKFFKTWKVTEKQKVKLLHRLKDMLVEFGLTKFGSRLIDVIWLWADIPHKKIVAEVLSQRIPMLAANKYGRFLVENLGLNAFIRGKKEWTEHMASESKRKQTALDIATELGLKLAVSETKPTPESEEAITPKKKNKKRKSERPSTESEEADLKPAILNETETQTPKKKKKKDKKSEGISSFEDALILNSSDHIEAEDVETPKKKKKNKKRKSEEFNETQEELETPKKKKKKDKDRKSEINAINEGLPDTPESGSKKKKKSKKSKIDLDLDLGEEQLAQVTPEKKKKKHRKSEK